MLTLEVPSKAVHVPRPVVKAVHYGKYPSLQTLHISAAAASVAYDAPGINCLQSTPVAEVGVVQVPFVPADPFNKNLPSIHAVQAADAAASSIYALA